MIWRLGQVAKGIGLNANENKTGFMCFKQEEDISILSGQPLKFFDMFS